MKYRRKASLAWLGRKFTTQFLAGILVLAPIGATALILIWIFVSIDNILQPLLRLFLGHSITGIGFGIAVALIYVTGLVASNIGGKRLVRYGQSLLSRVPIVRPLYTTLKQILESFSPTGQAGFMQTVLVEFPRKGMRSIGFITNELPSQSGKKLLNIYIPTAPNPVSGFLQVLSEDEVIRTNIPINEAMKMIISAGKISPQELQTIGL